MAVGIVYLHQVGAGSLELRVGAIDLASRSRCGKLTKAEQEDGQDKAMQQVDEWDGGYKS